MTTKTCRVHALAVLHVWIAGLVLAVPSGPSSAAHEVDPLDPSVVQLLEELSEWVDEDDEPATVRTSIREKSDSFEVFRSYYTPEVQYEHLDVPFGDLVREAAEAHDLDAFLLAAVVEVESGFDPAAVSPRGAVGLAQVLPSTAAMAPEHLMDPRQNLDQGARYLVRMLDRFEGDLELALAAYNAGPTNVRRYGGVPPFRETRRYVEKVLDRYVDLHRTVWQASDENALLTVG
ncbi:MAG: lytic transglycosylase domain-containing protein [Holophagales bacterium]|nr:lytic transglycosylase domain-containing protein [Holophagales bacterium]